MYDVGIYSIDKKTMSVFCQLQRKYYKNTQAIQVPFIRMVIQYS